MSEGEEVAKKFLKTVEGRRLSSGGERWLVALSGGVDSVTLLHLLRHLPLKVRPSVEAAHFNHRLRAEESDEDERFARDLCRQWEVSLHVGQAPDWKTKSNLQAQARELRYRFLGQTASQLGIRKIATAHQADDQAETFLIRWLQGAGLQGLAGMPLVRQMIQNKDLLLIRPLLLISRSEIAAYARHFRIPFREDSTNKRENYLRTRIRRLLVSLTEENPNLADRAALNSLFLQADQSYLDQITGRVFDESVTKEEGRLVCSVKVYQNLPDALRFRLLQRMVKELISPGAAFAAEAIFKMDELINDRAPQRHYDLPKRIGFSKNYVVFELFKKP